MTRRRHPSTTGITIPAPNVRMHDLVYGTQPNKEDTMPKRDSKDEPYVENYAPLKAWLNHHNAVCVWQIPYGGTKAKPMSYLECYRVGRGLVIVQIFENLHGWEIYTTSCDNDVAASLRDATVRCKLAPDNRVTIPAPTERTCVTSLRTQGDVKSVLAGDSQISVEIAGWDRMKALDALEAKLLDKLADVRALKLEQLAADAEAKRDA